MTYKRSITKYRTSFQIILDMIYGSIGKSEISCIKNKNSTLLEEPCKIVCPTKFDILELAYIPPIEDFTIEKDTRILLKKINKTLQQDDDKVYIDILKGAIMMQPEIYLLYILTAYYGVDDYNKFNNLRPVLSSFLKNKYNLFELRLDHNPVENLSYILVSEDISLKDNSKFSSVNNIFKNVNAAEIGTVLEQRKVINEGSVQLSYSISRKLKKNIDDIINLIMKMSFKYKEFKSMNKTILKDLFHENYEITHANGFNLNLHHDSVVNLGLSLSRILQYLISRTINNNILISLNQTIIDEVKLLCDDVAENYHPYFNELITDFDSLVEKLFFQRKIILRANKKVRIINNLSLMYLLNCKTDNKLQFSHNNNLNIAVLETNIQTLYEEPHFNMLFNLTKYFSIDNNVEHSDKFSKKLPKISKYNDLIIVEDDLDYTPNESKNTQLKNLKKYRFQKTLTIKSKPYFVGSLSNILENYNPTIICLKRYIILFRKIKSQARLSNVNILDIHRNNFNNSQLDSNPELRNSNITDRYQNKVKRLNQLKYFALVNKLNFKDMDLLEIETLINNKEKIIRVFSIIRTVLFMQQSNKQVPVYNNESLYDLFPVRQITNKSRTLYCKTKSGVFDYTSKKKFSFYGLNLSNHYYEKFVPSYQHYIGIITDHIANENERDTYSIEFLVIILSFIIFAPIEMSIIYKSTWNSLNKVQRVSRDFISKIDVSQSHFDSFLNKFRGSSKDKLAYIIANIEYINPQISFYKENFPLDYRQAKDYVALEQLYSLNDHIMAQRLEKIHWIIQFILLITGIFIVIYSMIVPSLQYTLINPLLGGYLFMISVSHLLGGIIGSIFGKYLENTLVLILTVCFSVILSAYDTFENVAIYGVKLYIGVAIFMAFNRKQRLDNITKSKNYSSRAVKMYNEVIPMILFTICSFIWLYPYQNCVLWQPVGSFSFSSLISGLGEPHWTVYRIYTTRILLTLGKLFLLLIWSIFVSYGQKDSTTKSSTLFIFVMLGVLGRTNLYIPPVALNLIFQILYCFFSNKNKPPNYRIKVN